MCIPNDFLVSTNQLVSSCDPPLCKPMLSVVLEGATASLLKQVLPFPRTLPAALPQPGNITQCDFDLTHSYESGTELFSPLMSAAAVRLYCTMQTHTYTHTHTHTHTHQTNSQKYLTSEDFNNEVVVSGQLHHLIEVGNCGYGHILVTIHLRLQVVILHQVWSAINTWNS